MLLQTFEKLTRFGVVHRDEIKNDKELLKKLLHLKLIKKIHKGRQVFYELTERSIPLLEAKRKAIYEEAKIMRALHKPPSAYHALIEDVRFLDEKHPAAKEFRFLGDWQLTKPVVPSQLKLSQLRYYKEILHETR